MMNIKLITPIKKWDQFHGKIQICHSCPTMRRKKHLIFSHKNQVAARNVVDFSHQYFELFLQKSSLFIIIWPSYGSTSLCARTVLFSMGMVESIHCIWIDSIFIDLLSSHAFALPFPFSFNFFLPLLIMIRTLWLSLFLFSYFLSFFTVVIFEHFFVFQA